MGQTLYLHTTRWGNLARAAASLRVMSWERYLTPAPNDTTTKPCSAVPLTQASNSCGNETDGWFKIHICGRSLPEQILQKSCGMFSTSFFFFNHSKLIGGYCGRFQSNTFHINNWIISGFPLDTSKPSLEMQFFSDMR